MKEIEYLVEFRTEYNHGYFVVEAATDEDAKSQAEARKKKSFVNLEILSIQKWNRKVPLK